MGQGRSGIGRPAHHRWACASAPLTIFNVGNMPSARAVQAQLLRYIRIYLVFACHIGCPQHSILLFGSVFGTLISDLVGKNQGTNSLGRFCYKRQVQFASLQVQCASSQDRRSKFITSLDSVHSSHYAFAGYEEYEPGDYSLAACCLPRTQATAHSRLHGSGTPSTSGRQPTKWWADGEEPIYYVISPKVGQAEVLR